MGQIRKQAIYSSIITYIGFIIGLINTYFFVKNGLFTSEQYGLTRLIADLGITLYSFATLGILSYIYRFHPYYKAHLKDKENDQFTWSITVSLIGFVLVTAASLYFQPLIVRKFTERSALLVDYYYWVLPYTLGFLLFSISEAFAWFRQKSILTNFLKETVLRVFQFVLILLFL